MTRKTRPARPSETLATYPPAQIAALGASRRIWSNATRYPTQVLAHSDVAPERKQDPGPGSLARARLATVSACLARRGPGGRAAPDAAHPWDALQSAAAAALLRLRPTASTAPGMSRAAPSCAPSSFTFAPPWSPAEPDAECQAILTALLERYFPEPG